jgi:formylglycine-generating enzyme required for sulfatase activity
MRLRRICVNRGAYCVRRAGSWYSAPWACRAGCRSDYAPARKYGVMGLRLSQPRRKDET